MATPEERRPASRLLALSADGVLSPRFSLPGLHGGGSSRATMGWGLAWYPEHESAAHVMKDAAAIGENPLTRVLHDWERFQSDTFLCQVVGPAGRNTQADTQPFARSFGGRDWVFVHAGYLAPAVVARLEVGASPLFEPVGRTDSERMFCALLTLAEARGARRLADLGWATLHEWLRAANEGGSCNLLLSDGLDLVVYQDRHRFAPLAWARLPAPQPMTLLAADDLEVDLGGEMARYRTVSLVSSVPLTGGDWREMLPGQLRVFRVGTPLWDSHAAATSARPATPLPRPAPTGARTFSVVHETTYRYTEPVERSTHVLRLQPVLDEWQEPRLHGTRVSVPSLRHDFVDVFGNRATTLTIETPYTELTVTSTSLVRVEEPAPLTLAGPRRVTLPLVWMPWQRQIMAPYLLPPELPETELRELIDYALGFVRRQDNDLAATLSDMNATIHRDFAYAPGETHVGTTPFEFYERRRGVCQDFANLMICLARLLNIPARYRVGYIHTGAGAANQAQSEASHAWAELYLPDHGWHGFDPTNGCLTGTDHLRVAAGRNYRDAAPFSGTILVGGGRETMTVGVRVEEVRGER
ncbi:MAG: class II glutamine amidotransferase [Gemmatimonadales bacterium]|nr:class II glutamine amidotransferase [Gemmatimonadales bacterium]